MKYNKLYNAIMEGFDFGVVDKQTIIDDILEINRVVNDYTEEQTIMIPVETKSGFKMFGHYTEGGNWWGVIELTEEDILNNINDFKKEVSGLYVPADWNTQQGAVDSEYKADERMLAKYGVKIDDCIYIQLHGPRHPLWWKVNKTADMLQRLKMGYHIF